MFYYAGVFFAIAMAAAILGFDDTTASTAGVAEILFYVFLLAALVSLVMSRLRR